MRRTLETYLKVLGDVGQEGVIGIFFGNDTLIVAPSVSGRMVDRTASLVPTTPHPPTQHGYVLPRVPRDLETTGQSGHYRMMMLTSVRRCKGSARRAVRQKVVVAGHSQRPLLTFLRGNALSCGSIRAAPYSPPPPVQVANRPAHSRRPHRRARGLVARREQQSDPC